jgi:hypothetical protein
MVRVSKKSLILPHFFLAFKAQEMDELEPHKPSVCGHLGAAPFKGSRI